MDILGKYVWWEGRMGVLGYWVKGWLPLLIASFFVGLVAAILGLEILVTLWKLFIVWAGFALTAKRWHDRDKSAWWMLIGLIPVVGPIWAFIETGFLPGSYRTNRFGPPPTPW